MSIENRAASKSPLSLPVGPAAIRVFSGFRADVLPRLPAGATEAEKRDVFFSEIGKTFMPGTPLMQAPLGLSAYIPIVVDPDRSTGVPDEFAIIVYSSLEQYQTARMGSLSRRMYTHSHAAVFNMSRSRAQFPGAIAEPNRLERDGTESLAWYCFDKEVDWQDGSTRVAVFTNSDEDRNFQELLLSQQRSACDRFAEYGCDQVVTVASSAYAATWVHFRGESTQEDLVQMGVVPDDVKELRNVLAEVAYVIGDEDQGVEISSASAFNFRFSRKLEFFLKG